MADSDTIKAWVSYPLGEVVGAIAVGLAEAQRYSDLYTTKLQEEYSKHDNKLDTLKIPNAQITEATVDLKFAIAAAHLEDSKEGKIPHLAVYVTAAELAELPERCITTMTFKIKVADTDVLVTDDLA